MSQIGVTPSCGNVFADLSLPNADALMIETQSRAIDDDMLARAENALEALTQQCGSACYWSGKGCDGCLCDAAFMMIDAIRARRNSLMVPL